MNTDCERTRCTLAFFLLTFSSPAWAATVELAVVAHNGSPVDRLNVVQALPGDRLEAEIFVSDWANDMPTGIRGYNLVVQGRKSCVSGANGLVLPLGWNAPLDPVVCASASECEADQICQSICAYPGHHPEFGAFRRLSRTDYLFVDYSVIDGISSASLNYLYFALAAGAAIDTGESRYVSTLILEVGEHACGTFRYEFSPCGVTQLSTPDGKQINPFLIPLVIQLPNCATLPIGSDPVNCTIDARIPHSPGLPGESLALRLPELIFNANPAGLDEASFRTRLAPPETAAPQVSDVTSLPGNRLRLLLSTVIPTNLWTCIEHRASGREFCVAALPGDVDQSRTVDVGDVDALLANLRRTSTTPSLPLPMCDTDRTQHCTPLDLLHLTDLLAGRGFMAWHGSSIGQSCPSTGELEARLERGACCQPGGSCLNDALESSCSSTLVTWFEHAACCNAPCDQIRGACCDVATGNCRQNVPESNCQGFSEAWSEGQACAQVMCEPEVGACCNLDTGGCQSSLLESECDGPNRIWYPGLTCTQSGCRPR